MTKRISKKILCSVIITSLLVYNFCSICHAKDFVFTAPLKLSQKGPNRIDDENKTSAFPTDGRLDIKNNWNSLFDNLIDPNLSNFIYDGTAINAAELGNIAYGYWGKSLGFSDETLFYGGGFARLRADGLLDDNIPKSVFSKIVLFGDNVFNRMITDKFYGDRPEDIEDIMKGIILYNKVHDFGCGGGTK